MAKEQPLQNAQDPWSNQESDLPDLDELFSKLKAKFRTGNSGGNNSQLPFGAFAGLVLAAVAVVWSVLGFYTIDEQQRAVVLRMGKYTQTLQPGLQWQPYIIDKVTKINVTKIRSLQSHGFMLTKDENIVEVALTVQYYIDSAKDYLLNIRDPERTLSNATDSVIRHEVGGASMDYVLTDGRAQLAVDVMSRLQQYADNYTSGIKISKVNIENTQAPKQVQNAFDDVIKAREDKERYQNQAVAYSNSIVPQARGTAMRQLAEADAYKSKVIANASGEADRFTKLLKEYKKAPQVTRDRLYIDTVEEVLSNTSKVLISIKSGNNMMYLPLDQLIKNKKTTASVDLDKYLPDSDATHHQNNAPRRTR